MTVQVLWKIGVWSDHDLHLSVLVLFSVLITYYTHVVCSDRCGFSRSVSRRKFSNWKWSIIEIMRQQCKRIPVFSCIEYITSGKLYLEYFLIFKYYIFSIFVYATCNYMSSPGALPSSARAYLFVLSRATNAVMGTSIPEEHDTIECKFYLADGRIVWWFKIVHFFERSYEPGATVIVWYTTSVQSNATKVPMCAKTQFFGALTSCEYWYVAARSVSIGKLSFIRTIF